MKRIIILLLPVILMAGCQNKRSFSVRGFIKEDSLKYIQLKRVNVNTLVLIDSAKIGNNGKFSIRVKATGPDFYQLGYSDSDFITLLAEPGERIRLDFKGPQLFGEYSVSGSEGSEQVKMLDQGLARTKNRLDSLRIIYEKASREPGFEEIGPVLEMEYSDELKELRKKTIEFVITHTHSLASLKALYQRIDDNTYVLSEPRDLQYLKIISDTLGRYYPDSRHVQALAEDLKNEMNRMYSMQFQSLAGSLPETRLDPNLLDVNGRRIALSSLRGKVVLLTFWSVGSKECIAENIQLKDFYKRYHSKGFEIYQINIDRNEDQWKNEVRFDELPWISTREDDPDDLENARLFNVQTLPTNYLFSRDGQIIGTNLHGRYLQIKLSQLFDN